MHAEIAALARKHALPAAVAADFEELWNRTRGHAFTIVDDHRAANLHAGDPRDLKAPSPDGSALIASRYLDLGPIAAGGMGEVRRVRDIPLNRTLAMKTLHARLLDRPAAVARFCEEARATAQLQHPGIVPIHDLGTLPDGRVWFTMTEVRGRTLGEVLREVHAASNERWELGAHGWTFRRIVAAFLSVCRAVAYAHERGVVHRDLKPDNVMVGAHGEVMVLDWGLAKVVGRAEPAGVEAEEEPIATQGSARATRAGTVVGTPAYMAPEQARGEVDRMDARTDIYALGAILYEILSGRPPYEGAPQAVLQSVRAGAPAPVGRVSSALTFGFGLSLDEVPPTKDGPPLPVELVDACERAMARDPADRIPSALGLASEVEAWLDGVKRREQVLQVVERTQEMVAESEALVAQAAALRAAADAMLADVAPWEPEERKAPGWDKAAQADAADLTAELKQLDVDQTLQAALRIAPDLPEAHAALAARHLSRHRAAEAARRSVVKEEALLQAHAAALPESHPMKRQVAAYLEGLGAVTLVTDPPGAEVLLYRYVERNRRLVEVFERSLGTTPLRSVALPMGTYLCVLRHPACDEVRYPLEVIRHGHWDGVRPGGRHPHPVWLPPHGYLGSNEVYVPPGRFRAGGDPNVTSFPAMRPWCDGFVLHRFPVTNRQYLRFLDDLVATGREPEALQHAPRVRAGAEGEQGALIYGYDGTRFALRPDADGDSWLADHPVVDIDWYGARAYLGWHADRTGRPWRLPWELEWEKAARGVDGRWYPWGDFLDPSWCRMFHTAQGRDRGDVGPSVVDSYPVDTSPSGVRGMGGNVEDWCLDQFDTPPPVVDDLVNAPDTASDPLSGSLRVARGGSWDALARHARSANRVRVIPAYRVSSLGFRGAFGVVPEPE